MKSTIHSQLFSFVTRGLKALFIDLPYIILLILLTTVKASENEACTNDRFTYINRYINVSWSFFAIDFSLGILLVCCASFVRVVIRDYEADDVESQPKIIARASKLKKKIHFRRSSSSNTAAASSAIEQADDSEMLENETGGGDGGHHLKLQPASSPAFGEHHHVVNFDEDTAESFRDHTLGFHQPQLQQQQQQLGPTIVTDLDMDELSFAHRGDQRSTVTTDTDLSTVRYSPVPFTK